MDLSSQEEEIPIPISSSYGHGRMIHHEPTSHNQIVPNSAAAAQIPSNGPLSTAMEIEEHIPYKRMIKYRECLKNHAAAMGGNATDGCGEFMPSGEEGTLEALTCSACNCHRNFHRKEVEGELSPRCHECFHTPHLNRVGRKLILGHFGPESQGYPTGPYIPSRPAPPPPPAAAYHHHQMMMSYNTMGSFPSESDEQEEGGGGGGGGGGFVVGRPTHHHHVVKKRFRTKFTQEQKEKMLNFAEKVGWKIQKQEESVVQQFCQEIGVKRRVLKVWMHNNKHNLAKKNPSTAENINPI